MITRRTVGVNARARSDPSPQARPANRLFKPLTGMERAGLEPATPSLQILLRGGRGGSDVVGD